MLLDEVQSEEDQNMVVNTVVILKEISNMLLELGLVGVCYFLEDLLQNLRQAPN